MHRAFGHVHIRIAHGAEADGRPHRAGAAARARGAAAASVRPRQRAAGGGGRTGTRARGPGRGGGVRARDGPAGRFIRPVKAHRVRTRIRVLLSCVGASFGICISECRYTVSTSTSLTRVLPRPEAIVQVRARRYAFLYAGKCTYECAARRGCRLAALLRLPLAPGMISRMQSFADPSILHRACVDVPSRVRSYACPNVRAHVGMRSCMRAYASPNPPRMSVCIRVSGHMHIRICCARQSRLAMRCPGVIIPVFPEKVCVHMAI